MNEKPKLNKESMEKHFPRLHYDCDLSMLEYKPPIQVRVEQAVKEINLQIENNVYKAVRKYEINVDKDELIKALRYDRNQYDLGYRAGYSKAYELINEIIELLTEVKDDYRLNDEIREACAVRYAIGKVEELKKEYGGTTNDRK